MLIKIIFLETLFRREKHVQNSLVLWEGSSSSMETGHKIKEGGKGGSGDGQEKGQKDVYVCVLLCFCERDKEVRK